MAKVTLFEIRNREKGQVQESLSAFGLVKETNTSCFGWALIPNHFHLVLKTGDVPIATVMRCLLTGIWGFTKTSVSGVEEQRVLVVADITSEPKLWKRLGHGYRVEASFILWEGV